MAWLLLWIVLAATTVVMASATTSSPVLKLTLTTFHDTVSQTGPFLIEFSARTPHPFDEFVHDFDLAAGTLASDGIRLGRVDCTAEHALCQRFEITTFPTLTVFRNGNSAQYTGGRTTLEIVTLMRRQKQQLLTILKTKREVKKFFELNYEGMAVIGYAPALTHVVASVLQSVADELHGKYRFGIIIDSEVASPVPLFHERPGIVLFYSPDGRHFIYEREIETNAFKTWVTNAMPVMAEIGPHNYKDYTSSRRPLAYFFYQTNKQKATIGAQVEKVAWEFVGKMNFVYCDANKYGVHANALHLKEKWPALVITAENERIKWPFDQTKDLTIDSVREFVDQFRQQYFQGKLLKPPARSVKEPAGDAVVSAGVVTVVGDSFNKHVLNPTKNVLIMFYAPWCQHSMRLAQTWNKLGQYFANDPNIVIAKMDVTKNDVPTANMFHIEEFPTIRMYRAQSNAVDKYVGNRSYDDLVEFVKKRSVPVRRPTTTRTEDSNTANPPIAIEPAVSGDAHSAAATKQDAVCNKTKMNICIACIFSSISALISLLAICSGRIRTIFGRREEQQQHEPQNEQWQEEQLQQLQPQPPPQKPQQENQNPKSGENIGGEMHQEPDQGQNQNSILGLRQRHQELQSRLGEGQKCGMMPRGSSALQERNKCGWE
ncbi:protein disulfide isomerase [Allomyces macrogynus ATCC 38327]|uniref:protein disulfide-isomerase n=1 Tax=Allomyces macrogynus (strain ATCC 38327) TaxID=578462 RepID=A0A0L0T0P6_ALLM3|nr:protein disulfide isomerase [Allomyces macrogynus ATCC 38327]|eukprot:KNE68225.1 protein disulfide isomerase [Allomyces macrogynus ATCC 38327]